MLRIRIFDEWLMPFKITISVEKLVLNFHLLKLRLMMNLTFLKPKMVKNQYKSESNSDPRVGFFSIYFDW